ncbi:GbsR/MarR family transcriptional regulator [Streptomyces iakyrus]|uniref:GbsR/MarR family transcriptional regulator n=1 Tax=Streptomyces iakyrus TaxID=68219 RepID=UPI0036E79808
MTRRDALMAVAPDGTRQDTGQELAVSRFIEQFALSMAGLGFPRMAARVFVAVLISKDGLTAVELANQLKISRAAVSQAVRYLMQLGLVERQREPGQRHDHYRVTDGMWYEMFARRDEVFLRLEDNLADGIAALGSDSPGAARLDETRRFFEFIRGEVPKLMTRWRESQGETPAEES